MSTFRISKFDQHLQYFIFIISICMAPCLLHLALIYAQSEINHMLVSQRVAKRRKMRALRARAAKTIKQNPSRGL